MNLLQELKEWSEKQPNKILFTFLDDNGKEVDRITYKEVTEQATAIAKHLTEEKKGSPQLKPGDRVLLVYPPSLHFIVAFIGCLQAKLVPVPVYPPALNNLRANSLDNFCSIQASCKATVALTTRDFNTGRKAIKLRQAFSTEQHQWPDLTWIESNAIAASSQSIFKKGLFGTASVAAEIELSVDPNDLAFLQYTSGSTSEPKGVMLTHGNVAHNLELIVRELDAHEDTIVVSWLPQYHDMGLIGAYLGVIKCGGSGYYMSPLSFIKNPVLWIRMIHKYRGTHMQAPNFAYGLTARKFNILNPKPSVGEVDLSCVRHMINGAEPVDAKTVNTFTSTFEEYGLGKNGPVVFPTYGLAEHCVFVCTNGKQELYLNRFHLEMERKVVLMGKEETEDKQGSTLIGCGFPPDEVEVAIVDTDDDKMKRLGRDQVGEIWLKSESKARGYWDMEEKTQEDFEAEIKSTGSGPGADSLKGYLRTGDLGFLHEDPDLHKNELFVCGRVKDLIIIRGKNMYPQDVEKNVENALPDQIRPGCSAAISVSRGGVEYVIYICEVRKTVAAEEHEQIVTSIKQTIATEHGEPPAHVLLLPQGTIIKTTSGKISRSANKKALLNNELRVLFEWMDGNYKDSKPMGQRRVEVDLSKVEVISTKEVLSMTEEQIVHSLTEELSHFSPLTPEEIKSDTPLLHCGIGSLDIGQFQSVVNTKFSVQIPDEFFFRQDTSLRSLAVAIKNGGKVPDPEATDGAGETTIAVQQPDQLAVQCPCLLGFRRCCRRRRR